MGHSKCFLLSSIIWMSDNIPQTQMAAGRMVGMKARRTVLFSKSRLSPVARVSFPLSLRYFHLHEQRLERGNPSVWKDREGKTTWEVRERAIKRVKGKGSGIWKDHQETYVNKLILNYIYNVCVHIYGLNEIIKHRVIMLPQELQTTQLKP